MKSFIKLMGNKFKSYSFINVCSGLPGQDEKITDQLTQLVKKAPDKVMVLWVNDLLHQWKRKTRSSMQPLTGFVRKTLKCLKDKMEKFIQPLKR